MPQIVLDFFTRKLGRAESQSVVKISPAFLCLTLELRHKNVFCICGKQRRRSDSLNPCMRLIIDRLFFSFAACKSLYHIHPKSLNPQISSPVGHKPGPEVIKLFSSSAQLSMKNQLLITVKIVKIGGKFIFIPQNLVIYPAHKC